MATELYLDDFAVITLDGNGNGRASKTPPSGVAWKLSTVAVSCSSNVNEAQCSIYVGGASNPTNLIDQTFSGSTGDSTSKVEGSTVYPGHYVWAVWSGGDAGATATMSLFGTSKIGYRS